MPISFGSDNTGGELFIRSNLPQNRWYYKDDGVDVAIDMDRGFAIDIKEVVFGWLHIDIGVRDWVPWPSPSQQIAKPSDSHKNGFEVKCWLSDGREASMSGNSFGLGQFIAKLYNKAEEAPEFTQGKVARPLPKPSRRTAARPWRSRSTTPTRPRPSQRQHQRQCLRQHPRRQRPATITLAFR